MAGRYGDIHSQEKAENVEAFRKLARRGDEILDKMVKEMCYSIRRKPYTPANIPNLVSNYTLSQFDLKVELKWANYTAVAKVADMVESYIWFLHMNYGKGSTKRYIKSNVDRLYREGRINIR